MKITLHGTPIPKNRHKCGCDKSRHPYVYDPQVRDQMHRVKREIARAYTKLTENENITIAQEAIDLPHNQSYMVSYVFIFPIPDREALVPQNAKLWGWQLYNQKPDFDNLEKFYTDCGTGILWGDDAMIVKSSSKKIYSKNPRTEIEVMAIKDLDLNSCTKGVLGIFGPDKLKQFCDDVTVFWGWPTEMIDELTSEGHALEKEKVLNSMANKLLEFALKHATDLKKILKYEEKSNAC
jgi:Holliday junction resolvase RusA-like endonuclease